MITESEVHEFLNRFEQLSRARDFDLIEHLVHADALFRFNDGDFRGRAAVREIYEKTWALSADDPDEKYYLTDIEILSADQNSAAATFTYNWEGGSADQAFSIRGRGTFVLVKADGQLQIIHEHLSRVPKQQLARAD